MKVTCRYFTAGMILVLLFAGCGLVKSDNFSQKDVVFSFIVTSDMREFAGPEYQTSDYFLGTCEAILKVGKGAFMVSPGDIDPPQHVYATISKVLGKDYPWYPVVGNHEAETPEEIGEKTTFPTLFVRAQRMAKKQHTRSITVIPILW